MCRRVDQLLVEKDRGLYQWFLRQDAFGHGERKDKMGEREFGRRLEEKKKKKHKREKKKLFSSFN